MLDANAKNIDLRRAIRKQVIWDKNSILSTGVVRRQIEPSKAG